MIAKDCHSITIRLTKLHIDVITNQLIPDATIKSIQPPIYPFNCTTNFINSMLGKIQKTKSTPYNKQTKRGKKPNRFETTRLFHDSSVGRN